MDGMDITEVALARATALSAVAAITTEEEARVVELLEGLKVCWRCKGLAKVSITLRLCVWLEPLLSRLLVLLWL